MELDPVTMNLNVGDNCLQQRAPIFDWLMSGIYYIEIHTRGGEKARHKLKDCEWSPNMRFEEKVDDHLNSMSPDKKYTILFTHWEGADSEYEYKQLRQILYVHHPHKHPAIYVQPSLQTIVEYEVNF